jgi:uncharacterized coiled-coil protein SlyX
MRLTPRVAGFRSEYPAGFKLECMAGFVGTRTLQQTVSSNQSETKQLSDQINALSGKLEALQQSFASAQQAPIAVLPTDQRPKRGAR